MVAMESNDGKNEIGGQNEILVSLSGWPGSRLDGGTTAAVQLVKFPYVIYLHKMFWPGGDDS